MHWWLSFADDDGFRGCCIIEAPGQAMAVAEAHRLGCNPGGEVLSMMMPSDFPEVRAEIERWGVGVLFDPSKEDGYVSTLDYPVGGEQK